MLRMARPVFAGALALLWAGGASATPVTFTFFSSASQGGSFASTQTFTPALPFSGTGDVDETAGTYSLSLPVFTVVIDVLVLAGDDSSVVTSGWGQTGTFAGGLGGPMTSSSASGSSACTDLGGGLGGLVCAGVPPTVAPWPPTGAAGPWGPAGAEIDLTTNTITVNTANDPNGGQVQSIYTYSFVPEPGTMLLLGMGLIGLATSGRRRA